MNDGGGTNGFLFMAEHGKKHFQLRHILNDLSTRHSWQTHLKHPCLRCLASSSVLGLAHWGCEQEGGTEGGLTGEKVAVEGILFMFDEFNLIYLRLSSLIYLRLSSLLDLRLSSLTLFRLSLLHFNLSLLDFNLLDFNLLHFSLFLHSLLHFSLPLFPFSLHLSNHLRRHLDPACKVRILQVSVTRVQKVLTLDRRKHRRRRPHAHKTSLGCPCNLPFQVSSRFPRNNASALVCNSDS